MGRRALGILAALLIVGCTGDDTSDDASPSPTTTTEAPGEASVCEVRAYVGPETSETDVAAVGDAIDDLPNVGSYRYIDKDETLAEFEELFADDETMLERGRSNPDLLPTSYVVTPATDQVADIGAIVDALQAQPGVTEVGAKVLGVPVTGNQDDPITIVVFLEQGIDDATREAVATAVEADAEVASYHYVDEEESRAEFERLFAGSEEMLEKMRENPELLPTSFRVVPVAEDPETVHAMEDRFAALPGVLRANSHLGMLETVQNALDVAGGCA